MKKETLRKKYLKSRGVKCPYCGSRDIVGIGSWEADVGYVTHKIHCIECKNEWEDLYRFSDILFP